MVSFLFEIVRIPFLGIPSLAKLSFKNNSQTDIGHGASKLHKVLLVNKIVAPISNIKHAIHFMFLGMFGNDFPYEVSELGGVRLII